MRDIEFRGISKQSNKFVYGFFYKGDMGQDLYTGIESADSYIMPYNKCVGEEVEIKPETLEQYTGLKDYNGVKIFEGDIVEHIPKFEVKYIVKYLTSGFYLCPDNENYGESFCSLFAGYDEKLKRCNKIKIIGNIHENYELMEG